MGSNKFTKGSREAVYFSGCVGGKSNRLSLPGDIHVKIPTENHKRLGELRQLFKHCRKELNLTRVRSINID